MLEPISRLRGVDSRNLVRAVTFRSASLGLGGFFLAIFRRRRSFQRTQQPARNLGDIFDRFLECFLVRLRRLVEAGNFPHELQRRRVYFVRGHRRLKIEKRSDVATHGYLTSQR